MKFNEREKHQICSSNFCHFVSLRKIFLRFRNESDDGPDANESFLSKQDPLVEEVRVH